MDPGGLDGCPHPDKLKRSRSEIENGNKMEEKEEGRAVVNGVVNDYWWWAAASAVQLGWGVSACRRGYAGPSGLMPFKACAVSTLFVGAFASAAVATLRLSGISTVEDMKTLGANVRAGVGLRSRAGDE